MDSLIKSTVLDENPDKSRTIFDIETTFNINAQNFIMTASQHFQHILTRLDRDNQDGIQLI